MNTVQSKYKNPDKYIKEMKAENDRLYKEAWEMFGDHQFSWTEVETTEYDLMPTAHPRLLPGAKVRIEAHVTEIHRDTGSAVVTLEHDECYLTEEA